MFFVTIATFVAGQTILLGLSLTPIILSKIMGELLGGVWPALLMLATAILLYIRIVLEFLFIHAQQVIGSLDEEDDPK